MYIRNLIIIISKILIISKNISILNLEYSLQVLLNYNYTIASIVCCAGLLEWSDFVVVFPGTMIKSLSPLTLCAVIQGLTSLPKSSHAIRLNFLAKKLGISS